MRFIDNVSSLFSSINSSNKNKRKKKTAATPSKSISKYDDNPSSFGSSTTSLSSASDFSSSSSSSTPKSVLPLSVSDVFNLFDRDRDGKITRFELQTVLRQLGHDPPLTDKELDSMVQEIDRDGDGCISLEELAVVDQEISGLGGWSSSSSSSSVEEEMRDAFRVFDADGDGKISAEELMGVFVALGEEDCGIEECRRMIAGVDSDGDGFVCFQDFLKMMMVEGAAKMMR